MVNIEKNIFADVSTGTIGSADAAGGANMISIEEHYY